MSRFRILRFLSALFLVLALAAGAACPPAAAEESFLDGATDLTLDTICRAMERENSRNAVLAQLMEKYHRESRAMLDELEGRYEELSVAVYYQDYSNFFHLTHCCKEIAELRKRCSSGSFPITRTRLRMEMAIHRYAFLNKAMADINVQKLTPKQQEQLKAAIADCTELEKTYKEHHAGMNALEEKFNDICRKIRRLDLYANGSAVEQYANMTGSHTPIDIKKLVDMGEKKKAESGKGTATGKRRQQPAEQEEQATTLEKAHQINREMAQAADGKENADTERRRAAFVEMAVEDAKAYGTDIDVTKEVSIAEEQKTEGRLAARIATCLWDPSHPTRKMEDYGSYLTRWSYLGMALRNNYVDPYDAYFAHALTRTGLLFLALAAAGAALALGFRRLRLRRMPRRASRHRLDAVLWPLVCGTVGAGLFLAGYRISPSYLGDHVQDMGEYLLMTAGLFGSMAVYLNSRRVMNGIRLFLPLATLNFTNILYSVMMCTSFMVDTLSAPVHLACGLWMTLRFFRRMANLRISARVFAVLSIIMMFAGAAACFRGYYYLAIMVELSWHVLLTNIMLMSALSKACKLATRRIATRRSFSRYHRYLCAWVRLVVSHMVQPLIFLGLLWYGLSWSAECFDLSHFLHSWMGTPHHPEGFIRSISANGVLLLITVGIALNCLIQVARQTLLMVYGDRMDAGRSQTLMTLGALLLWCSFGIFALNELDADYNSMLVVMGGMSVGVGIGLKDTIENLACGISLMLGRMRPGDMVECDGVRGRVANIGYRTTTLETAAGSIICFQNAQLFNQNFTNLTRNHRYERCSVTVGVAYGTDIDRARRLVMAALRHLPGLSRRHASAVTLDEFADSSVNLNVWVWVPVDIRAAMLSRVREAIYRHFNDNGIEIPFPQQDLYIKTLPQQAAETPALPGADKP